ncbi:NAD(P)/FAD-dependent oxidoreductase [Candidatus Micrarchaeota archaeon]|nr:NAD(P)/FAD-dependent oxidoreductase [Candidatus Micrarchaeota archaeon]MBU1930771.1 NAD(P)/FAD-dependent oxidoreductase [Candidatus Micrarchaeota archaeon]
METREANQFDVIIVGAGPGGSSAALYLAKKGRNVLLLDKAVFPRDKVCGDAMGTRAVAVLRELGIAQEMENIKHEKVYGVVFSSPKRKLVQIPFPGTDPKTGKGGYVVRRELFDDFLFQNAKKKAVTRENFLVTDLVWKNDFVVGIKGKNLETDQEEEFHAKVVIGADGANSIVATKLGLNKTLPKHECIALRVYYENISGCSNNIEIHFVDSLLPGYFWIFPLENNTANVGVGMITHEIRKHKVTLEKAMFQVIQNDPLFKERFKNAKVISDVKGWRLPLGSYHRKAHGNGWILVGDAAALIDPFSGEGVGNAMVSARVAGTVLEQAFKTNDFSESFLKQYEDGIWKELGSELKTSYQLQRMGRITPLLNLVIGKASKSKEIRETISGMIANENAKHSLINPLFYLKLLFA